MLGKHDEIGLLPGVDLIAGAARGCLQPLGAIRRHIDFVQRQRNILPLAAARAKRGPAARVRADVVVDVHAGKTKIQRAGKPAQHLQQHHRIQAAGQTQRQPGPRKEQGPERRAYGGFDAVRAIRFRLP